MCPGVQLGRSGVLRTGQDLVTDPRRQSITSQWKSESRHLNRSQPLQTRVYASTSTTTNVEKPVSLATDYSNCRAILAT